MNHDLKLIREEGHHFIAVCVCGHETRSSASPNEETARSRHEFHLMIEEARARLAGGASA